MTKLMKRTISFIIWLSVFFVIFNIPGFKLNAYADDEPIVLPEIYITSDTTSVYTGKLPAYSVNTSTEHVSIKSYNSRTGWGYIDPTLVSWYGFGLNEPMAINDGKTRYGMRLYAVVDDGYAITYDTKVYFNGKEQQIKKEDLDICSWGAIIIIDLGYASGSNLSTHTVSFETDGGSSVAVQTVFDGNTVPEPNKPNKNAAIFDGWYEDKSCTIPYDFNKPVTTDMVLYAKWLYVSVIPEIRLESDTAYVLSGELPAYSVNTSTEHVSIESYNPRTGWGYIDPTLVSWYGFGFNEPMAINDGKTRYGMRLYAVVDDGYAITYDTKVYFNGKEQQIKKEDLDICSWGAIIIIDLGYTKNIVTGKAGDDAVWTLDFDTGEMVISGTGSIYDSNNPEMFTQKVDNYSDIIKSVTYEHGITSTGNTIFGFCQNINSVTLSNTIEYIEPGTFAGTQFSSITIPKSVTKIDEYAFMGSSNLTVIYSGTEQEWNKINISKTENKRLLNATILYNDSEAGITKVDGVSVSLDSGLIGLNFYFDDLNKLVNTGAYISLNGTKYNISNANANSKWKYSYYVNAKEMGDKIKVEIIDKDGKRIPLGNNNSIDGVFYCSVNDYLNAVKKGDNSQLAQLANAMSDYGLCAQDYFGYNTPKQIPTISDGNYDKYDVITSGNLPTGVSYVGSSLLLKSSTSIRHYFNTNDKNVTFTVNGTTTAAVKEGTLCYIEISNINAVNLDKNYIITVSDGSNTYSIKYSALSYCQKANNSSTDTKLKRLVNSMYWYNQAANEYLKIM